MLPLHQLDELDLLVDRTEQGDDGAAVEMLKLVLYSLPPMIRGRVAELIVRIEGEHAELGTGDTPRLR